MNMDNQYINIWNSFLLNLKKDASISLRQFLITKSINYKNYQKWMKRQGLSVKKAKESLLSIPRNEANNAEKTVVAKEKEPTTDLSISKENVIIKDIALNFPNGIKATLKNENTHSIIKLIESYGKSTDAMSFRESLDLVELPVVTFRQGSRKINLLLDTGSNNCIIDKTFLECLEHIMLEQTTNLMGMEGNNNITKVCSLKLSYKDKEYEYPYIVQDMSAAFGAIKNETGVTIHGILGSKFFNEFKYVLDFEELIAYSKE